MLVQSARPKLHTLGRKQQGLIDAAGRHDLDHALGIDDQRQVIEVGTIGLGAKQTGLPGPGFIRHGETP